MRKLLIPWVLGFIVFTCLLYECHKYFNKPAEDNYKYISSSPTMVAKLADNADLSEVDHLKTADEKYLHPPPQSWLQDQFKRSIQILNLTNHFSNKWSSCKDKLLTYFFPKIRAMFTGIPKTGCTNWKGALLYAEGTMKTLLEPKQMKRVHGGMSNQHRLSNTENLYSDEVMSDTFSFVVIRNPWTRLVSGYVDKFSKGYSRGPYRVGGKKMVQMMRGIENKTLLEDLYPTFDEYIKWISIGKGRDRHFAPQHSCLCYTENIYDFIVPLEYSSVMSKEVWSKINASATLYTSYDHLSDPRKQSTTMKAKEWISKIDPAILETVYIHFKGDFALANYSNVTDPDFPLPIYS